LNQNQGVSRFIRLKAKKKEIFITREEKSIGLVSTAKLPKKKLKARKLSTCFRGEDALEPYKSVIINEV